MQRDGSVKSESARVSPATPIGPYRLGLDAGSGSLGWAVVLLDESAPEPLVACGVRVFPAGTDKDKVGNEILRNEDRRTARQMRRQLARKRARRSNIARILREMELVPQTDEERSAIMAADPYALRARALDSPLTAAEVGRALFHLAKRRGFESSRKAQRGNSEKEKEQGKVLGRIAELKAAMEVRHSRTLGEFLSQFPHLEARRRGQYLHRDMLRAEFDAICSVQGTYHPALANPELVESLRHAIFYQRPLKPQTALIGKCELEPEEYRAAKWHWEAHEVRMLQEVSNLRILDFKLRSERPLTEDERNLVVAKLRATEKEVAFDELRNKVLKLGEYDKFNLESLHRSKLDGQRVEAGLAKLFKKRWKDEADLFRHVVWPAYNEMEDEDFDRRAIAEWGLSPEEIKKLGGIRGGTGYGAYSLKALKRLLPELESGKSIHDARVAAYGERARTGQGFDLLPAADRNQIRNPVVLRILSETRKVVNAIIREYGKPAEIIVEMARETKGSVDQRNKKMKEIRDNQRERERIRDEFSRHGRPEPTGTDIVKYRLWIELGGPESAVCPYTGDRIVFDDLFGDAPRFDIEHIIPYSRCMDDSFSNKTLCAIRENREVKRNRAPAEAYRDDPKKMEEILQRVRHSKMRYFKAQRFMMEGRALAEHCSKFSTRQLTDTSYAARLIRESLQQLYPGELLERSNPVRTSNGAVTGTLRRLWGLNSMLPIPPEAEMAEEAEPGEKHRLDHRHHAVDAVVIALSTQGHVQRMARRYEGDPGTRFRLDPPWANLRQNLKKLLETMNVSFAPRHRVSGQINKETASGLIHTGEHAGKYAHRVSIDMITDSQAERIIDPEVRAIVLAWLEQKREWQKLSMKEKKDNPGPEPPRMKAGPKAKHRPVIRKVRIWESIGKPIGLPTEQPYKYVESAGNHHATFFEVDGGKKGKRIVVRVCTLFEAYRRMKYKEPVVQRTDREFPNAKFLFSLMINDMVCYRREGADSEILTRVQKMSGDAGRIDLVLRSAIAATTDYDTQKIRLSSFGVPLSIRRVTVDPLGRIYPKKGSIRE